MASGNTLIVFGAADALLPSTTYPQFVVRNNHRLLAFQDATDELCYFEGVLPRNYASGGVTMTLYWAAASATTGNVVWSVGFERIQDDVQDMDSDSFATDNTVTDTCASASGELSYPTIAFTDGAQMDSVAVGEALRIRVTRDANNASDTMSGDAQLLAIEIKET